MLLTEFGSCIVFWCDRVGDGDPHALLVAFAASERRIKLITLWFCRMGHMFRFLQTVPHEMSTKCSPHVL